MKQFLQVQVGFTEDTPFGRFTDAIYYPYDDFGHVSQEDINREAQRRIDEYLLTCKVRTKEEQIADLEFEKANLTTQRAEAITRIASIDAALAEKRG